MKLNELYRLINEDFDDSDSNIESILNELKKHTDEKLVFMPTPVIIKSAKYGQNPESHTFDKPNGFWYALGDEWGQYLKTHDKERYTSYDYIASIDIDYADILKINSSQKLEDFHKNYSVKRNFNPAIDWKKVSEDYKGIEIIPYRPEFRHIYLWYNVWDLASGCIWDLSAIKDYTIIYK